MRKEFERRKRLQDRVADAITRFTGSMVFVYVHLLFFAAWFVFNAKIVRGVRPWDPYPFVMLAMIASVEAIFLSTFVLISQNRMQVLGDKRADLDVQVNLLTEHELTRLLTLVDAVARKLEVEPPPDVRDLEVDVAPSDMLGEIERDIDDEHPSQP